MVGPGRPQFVLFGSSIVQMSLVSGGWGSIIADLYDRKLICIGCLMRANGGKIYATCGSPEEFLDFDENLVFFGWKRCSDFGQIPSFRGSNLQF